MNAFQAPTTKVKYEVPWVMTLKSEDSDLRVLNLWPGVRVTPGAPVKIMVYGINPHPFS
jgi:hypothetical protein